MELFLILAEENPFKTPINIASGLFFKSGHGLEAEPTNF